MTTPIATAAAAATIDAAEPYPWPFHGELSPVKTALVACMDARWRSPGPGSDEADARLALLARGLASVGALVVAVRATPRRRHGGWPQAPDGAGLPLEADVTLEAGATSGFYGSGLDDVLRGAGRSDLVVAGWGLEGPVHSTLRAANDRGYECVLVPDACAPGDPGLAAASCAMVRMSGGIFGAFAPSRAVVEAFTADRQTPAARAGTPPRRQG